LEQQYNRIVSAITPLAPEPWNGDKLQHYYLDGFADSGAGIMPINRSGVARSLAETGSGLLVGVDIEYGAVERFSGFDSMAPYSITMDQIFELSPSDSSIPNKFQIRLWKQVMDVYLGLGLLDVWKSINDLRALVGNDPLPNPTFNGVPIAAWSFR